MHNNNDILWFIILFLLLFCGGCGNRGCCDNDFNSQFAKYLYLNFIQKGGVLLCQKTEAVAVVVLD